MLTNKNTSFSFYEKSRTMSVGGEKMARLETYKRKTISLPIILLAIFFLVLLLSSSLLILLYPFPSQEKSIYFVKEHPIIYEGEIFSEEALIKDGSIYLPFSFIKENVDETITFDSSSNSIIITTDNKVLQMSSETLRSFVNDKPFSVELPAFISENGTNYMSLEPVSTIYPFEVELIEETGAVIVRKDGQIVVPGMIKSEQKEADLRLRIKPDITTSYVATVSPGEKIEIEGEESKYYSVRKQNGVAGFVKKDMIIFQKPEMITIEIDSEERPLSTIEWPINLTWEAVYSQNPETSKLPKMPGINVVSPTWFTLKNENGDISNLGSMDYVNWAKSRDYQIWGLFSNDFDPEKTHQAFKDFETRQKIIRQLLEYSQMYQLDGINIDIENVNIEDKELITQFVREATPYFHQAGLVVSMDVTFLSGSENWSQFYEREKLSDVIDYMIIMAYDEHWGSSPEAGSVASFPWVEENLQQLLEIIPNDRLILAAPLYTRIWKEQETAEGNIEVSSKAYSMSATQNWISERNLDPVYDENSGQNYVEYREEDEKTTYKIWIEDEMSLTKRSKLVHSYSLAGIATWSRFFANDQAWETIDDSLEKMDVVEKD